MDASPKEIVELFDLLSKMLDEALSDEQKERLEHLLESRPSLHPYYVNFFLLNSELRSCLSVPPITFSNPDIDRDVPYPEHVSRETMPHVFDREGIRYDQERINKIRQHAERQLQAFLAEQERQRTEQQHQHVRLYHRLSFDFTTVIKKTEDLVTFASKSIVIMAALATLTLISMCVVNYIKLHRVVAIMGESVHAKWTEPLESTELRPGNLSLEEGFAQLVFTGGAQVILQAPCKVTLRSPKKMFVEEGTVIAKVPKRAIGFTVNTQTSSVKDLGTEFGVAVDSQARTEIHVFDGLIQLRSTGRGRSGRNQWEVAHGQTAIVDNSGNLKIGRVSDRPRLFIRDLPDANQAGIPGHHLNLADIVGGGNGFGTGKLGQGLHPQTGLRISGQTHVSGHARGYVPTLAHEFIDGIFIPDSENKDSITISSSGLQFFDCPDTSGECLHIIRNGIRFQHEQSEPQLGHIRGQIYGTPGHPAIGMHANAGITFDLDKIRAAHPGTRIIRFQSLCGISETVSEYSDGYWKSQRITVGFRVLVDGNLRFSKDLTAVPAQSAEIDITLQDSDRFLTLITTECHPDRPFSWSLFAEPLLELAPKKKNDLSTEISLMEAM